MSTEIDNLEKRVAALEARFPNICPDPTGEGSAWQGEAVRSVPVGWVRGSGQGGRRKTTKGWASAEESKSILYGQSIIPDPSIPWGEEYEAILPDEAREGDEFRDDYRDRHWVVCKDKGVFNDRFLSSVPRRRRKSPAEPAPGLDAEHPPVGYVLVPNGSGEKIGTDWISWSWGKGPWEALDPRTPGKRHASYHYPMARPIPANEGDSQKAGIDKIAESVVQDLQQACYDRDELRATVERLTSELDTTKRLLAESLVERDRLKNLHDARKVRIDGFRDVLRERLGDLV